MRVPGRGDIYLGPAGCWKDPRKIPAVVQQAYDRELSRWYASRAEGTDALPDKSDCTVKHLASAYLTHCEHYYRKDGRLTSEIGNVKMAVVPLLRLFGSTLAADFGKNELKMIRSHLVESGGHTRATINACLSRIRRLFRWAAEEADLVSEEVWLRLRVVHGLAKGRTTAREGVGVKPAPEKDVQAALPHLPELGRAMVEIQRLTGMRPIELCKMRVGDVAPDEEDPECWVYRVRDDANKLAHKDIARIVWIGPQAQAFLRPWLGKAAPEGADAWIFPNRHGNSNGYVSPHRYGVWIRKACLAAGVPPWAANQLRHARATKTRARFGLEGAQSVLGHSNVETTQIYAEKSDDLARRIARETG